MDLGRYIEERKLKVTTMDDKILSTRKPVVTMIHHIGWPQQGLPHEQLTEAQMKSSSQLTVVMCRLTHVVVLVCTMFLL